MPFKKSVSSNIDKIILKDKQYQEVLDECRCFFAEMAKTTGTLWEHSRLDSSLNHGFASIAALYIAECIKNIEN